MNTMYCDKHIKVFGGAWLDPMNSCFYTVIDRVPGFDICKMNDASGEVFALPCVN